MCVEKFKQNVYAIAMIKIFSIWNFTDSEFIRYVQLFEN